MSELEPVAAIYVVGPSSTGKTTLCNQLSQRLALDGPAYIKEVARTVMRQTGFSRSTIRQLEMQLATMEAQLEAESAGREYARRAGLPAILSDRSAVDALVYAAMTAQSEEEAAQRWDAVVHSAAFQAALPVYRAALFALLMPVPEWLEDDGVRSIDEPVRCSETFERVLGALEIPFHRMGPEMKDLERRVQSAMGMYRERAEESATGDKELALS